MSLSDWTKSLNYAIVGDSRSPALTTQGRVPHIQIPVQHILVDQPNSEKLQRCLILTVPKSVYDKTKSTNYEIAPLNPTCVAWSAGFAPRLVLEMLPKAKRPSRSPSRKSTRLPQKKSFMPTKPHVPKAGSPTPSQPFKVRRPAELARIFHLS